MRSKPLKQALALAALTALMLGTPAPARADAGYDLIQAAYDGNLVRVGQLAARGSNVNARDDYGYTALMWAAQQGHVLTCETLLKRGAEVDARDKAGRTALLIATVKNRPNVVKLLLTHHADPTLKAANGVAAADYARAYRLSAISSMFASVKPQPKPSAQGTLPRPVPKPMPTMGGIPKPLPTQQGGVPKPLPTRPPNAMPNAVPTLRPQPTMTQAPQAVAGSLNLTAQARDAIAKLHGQFMDHLGLRDPEAIVQKGFNQELEDKLDQVFLALDYGHTATMARQKLADARKLVNAAKAIAAQPDPQDDKTSRQILTALDQLLAGMGS